MWCRPHPVATAQNNDLINKSSLSYWAPPSGGYRKPKYYLSLWLGSRFGSLYQANRALTPYKDIDNSIQHRIPHQKPSSKVGGKLQSLHNKNVQLSNIFCILNCLPFQDPYLPSVNGNIYSVDVLSSQRIAFAACNCINLQLGDILGLYRLISPWM